MPHATKEGLGGLVTNIAETQAPQGTLIEAENVVMRRPGCIEPRDGLQLVQTLASGFAAYGFSWRTKDFILRNNGSNVFDWRDTAGGTYGYDDSPVGSGGLVDPQPFRRDCFSRAEARGSLYIPYEAGTLRMETDAGPWKYAGMPAYASVSLALVAGTFLPNGQQVAYRAVAVRVDANNMEVRSIPSGARVVANASGGARDVDVTAFASFGPEYTSVEIYRTRNFPSGVTPDEEYQLVAVVPSAAGVVTVTDRVLPEARGETLYTSPSRGGSNEENGLPPAAALMCLFRNSVFWANVRRPRQIVLSYAALIDRSGSATGLGSRTYTATPTNGSANLTLLSSTVGLEKGMMVLHAAVPAGAYITNISGTTVTMSQNATASPGAVSVVFRDAVALDGVWQDLFSIDVGAALTPFRARKITPPLAGYANTVVIEANSAAATARTIQATHGSEFNPPLPNYDGTPKQIAQDAWPGGIIWSKPDEPEHVRPIDYEFVGDQNAAILGLVPTRDALFILKEDGVFRLTGFNGDWRVDPFDPTAKCVLPGSVLPVRGRGVFLGDRGVAMVSDEGVEPVSLAINNLVKPVIDQIIAAKLSTGFYELPGMQGAFAASVFERESEYTLARGSTVPPLVYNDITQAWTTLAYYGHANESYAYRALFNFGRSSHSVLSLGVSYFKTILSTDAGAEYVRADRATAVTVNSYAAPNATLSAAINALEDDIIKDSAGRYWRITAVVNNSATVPVQLQGGTASMATGAGTLYRSLRCSVIATGWANPLAAQKCWGEILASFTRFTGPVRARYGCISNEAPAAFADQDIRTSLVPLDLVTPGTGFASYELGLTSPGYVNTDNARAWLLRLRISWAQAHGYVQLEGVSANLRELPENAKPAVKAA